MQSLIETAQKKLIVKSPQLKDVTTHYFVEELIDAVRSRVLAYHKTNSTLFRQESYFRIKASSRSATEWNYQIAMSGVPRSATLKHDSATETLTVLLKNRYLLRHNNLVVDPQIIETHAIIMTGVCDNIAAVYCDKISNWIAPKVSDKYLPREPSTVFITKNLVAFVANSSLVYSRKIVNITDNPHNNGAVVVLEKENFEIENRDTSAVYKRAKALQGYHGALYLLTNKDEQSMVVRENELKTSFKSVD